MTITLKPELEQRLQKTARKLGQDTRVYVEAALLRQLAADESQTHQEWLRQEFAQATSDPLFLQDIADTEAAFQSSDSQTARILPDN